MPMNKLLSLVLAAMLFGSSGAAGQATTSPATTSPGQNAWGFDLSGVDREANPGDSFFDYANGAWDARTAIPPDKARIGAFDTLRDNAQEQVRAIIEDASKSGAALDTNAGKIGALYNSFMDEARIEMLDATPIAGDLAKIRNAGTRTDIAALMGSGRGAFGSSFFSVTVSEDAKDPTRHTLAAAQSGLGLPDRDYYLKDTFKDKKAHYRDYVARMLGMVDWPNAQAQADAIVALETRIAEASWSRA